MKMLNKAIDELCECQYPVEAEEIRQRCGDEEIELMNGSSTTLKEIFELTDDVPSEFESKDDLRNYIVSFIPEGGIGRKYYDDRGGSDIPDQDQQSL